MPRSREEWEAEQNRLLAGYESVRARLMQIPGVVEVGVGLRCRDGAIEEEAVYVVSVVEKLPPDQVPDGELVPPTIDGVPTDVEVFHEPRLLLGFGDEDDTKNYATKVGGISISADGAGGRGTLGCFCRDNTNNTVVMLSNHHVLMARSAEAGSGVGQPEHESSCCCTCNEIGKVVRGDKNIDGAIATINADVPFFPKVRRIKRSDGTVEEEGLINGVADPVMNQIVWKVGKKTGLTRGRISKVTPRFEVSVEAAFTRFADKGDSGSVVVEKASGNVVGLLNGITTEAGTVGVMRSITAVQNVLNITVLVSDPSAVYTEAADDEDDEELFPLPAASPFESLVERLRTSEPTREILVALQRHVPEALTLVNRRRAFTVAWHRNRGPAWLAAFGRSARDPIYRVPEEIDGVQRAEALAAIATALRAEASDLLAADLDHFGPTLLTAFQSSGTVDELLGRFEPGLVGS
ncbi:MAG: hypothetical protein AB7Q42_13635 [Acidimicrobiia bacterium]